MATAPVSIAPVLTPHTLGVLADSFEQDHLIEQAALVRKLVPFVEGVVKRFFVPLLVRPRHYIFGTQFDELWREFEPFRIHLNFQLFSTLVNQYPLAFYEQMFADLLDPLIRTAREMGMQPELISAAVRDYIKIMRVVSEKAGTLGLEPQLTVEQFSEVVDWLHASTRFDYALTATFLVLERSLPEPTAADKRALLSACKEGLIDLGQAIARVFMHDHILRTVRDLETAQINIQGSPSTSHAATKGNQTVPRQDRGGFSHRQTEMNWLAQHKDLAGEYGGQWIVVEKAELIASDKDYGKARQAAGQKGIQRPFIIFVPSKEEGAFMGI